MRLWWLQRWGNTGMSERHLGVTLICESEEGRGHRRGARVKGGETGRARRGGKEGASTRVGSRTAQWALRFVPPRASFCYSTLLSPGPAPSPSCTARL